MLIKKGIISVTLALVLIITSLFGGCTAKEPATQEIIDNAIEANMSLKSYQFDVNMHIDLSGFEKDKPISAGILATGSGAMDTVNQSMKMDMDLEMNIPEMGKQNMDFSYFWVDDYLYMKITMPVVGEQWMKLPADSQNAPSSDQLAQHIELLKSATKSEKVGSEIINGIDCYILEVTPDMQAIMDWVKSQQQTASLQDIDLDEFDFNNLFKDITIREWITKDKYYFAKTEVSLTLEMGPQDMGIETQGSEKMRMEMRVTLEIKNWDKPVDIILPSEALKAREAPSGR